MFEIEKASHDRTGTVTAGLVGRAGTGGRGGGYEGRRDARELTLFFLAVREVWVDRPGAARTAHAHLEPVVLVGGRMRLDVGIALGCAWEVGCRGRE